MKFVAVDSHLGYNSDYSDLIEVLEKNGIEYVPATAKTDEEVIEACKGADAVGSIYSDMNEYVCANIPSVKVMVRYGIGYDNFNVEAATKNGIYCCNIPDYCTEEVASSSLAHMMNAMRKICYLDRQTRKGNWNSSNYSYEVHRPSCMTVGIISFGKIARKFSEYCKALGMRIIASDPYLPAEVFAQYGVESVSLEEVYKQSDVISVNCPLFPETYHLINKETIKMMKDNVIIVNTARGPSICLDDLVEALKSGKVGAASLDVFEGEPITDLSHPMYELDTLSITPHFAYYSKESIHEQHVKIGQTAVDVLNGKVPYNVLNAKQIAALKK
ncbi:MAG: C-terminal binding protein [Oscillospiraceae bacterium]